MTDEIIKLLDDLSKRFGIVIDWSSENIIPYLEKLCDKYVTYEIATSVVWILIGICTLFFAKWLIKKSKESHKKADYSYPWNDEACICFWSVVFAAILILVAFLICIVQIFDIVTCVTLPEKIIFDEIKDFYSSVNKQG